MYPGLKPFFYSYLFSHAILFFPPSQSWAISIDKIKHQVVEVWAKNLFCTGLIIDEHTVVTAAHCLMDPERKVLFKSKNITIRYLSDEIIQDTAENRKKTNKLIFPKSIKLASVASIIHQENDYAELKIQKPIKIEGLSIIPISKDSIFHYIKKSQFHPYELIEGSFAAIGRHHWYNSCAKGIESNSFQHDEFSSPYPYFLKDFKSYEELVKSYFSIERPGSNFYVNSKGADEFNKLHSLFLFHLCDQGESDGAYVRDGDSGTPVFVVKGQEVLGFIVVVIGGNIGLTHQIYINLIHYF